MWFMPGIQRRRRTFRDSACRGVRRAKGIGRGRCFGENQLYFMGGPRSRRRKKGKKMTDSLSGGKYGPGGRGDRGGREEKGGERQKGERSES